MGAYKEYAPMGLDLWRGFSRKTLLVTGAAGFLGRALLRDLAAASRRFSTDVHIVAAVRDITRAGEELSEFVRSGLVTLLRWDLADPFPQLPRPVDYVVHLAGETSSARFLKQPVDTFENIVLGVQRLLHAATGFTPQKVLFLSSLEVYGIFDGYTAVTEDMQGFLNPLDARGSYPCGKRAAESLCYAYFAQLGLPVVIGRLGVAFGEGTSMEDQRMLASFARSVIRREPIVIKSTGETVRSYCYSGDVVTAILTLLLSGVPGEAYNIANEDITMSVLEIARQIEAFYPDTSVVMEPAEDPCALGYLPTLRLRLDTGKLRGLGWQPRVGFEKGFRRMCEDMRGQKEGN